MGSKWKRTQTKLGTETESEKYPGIGVLLRRFLKVLFVFFLHPFDFSYLERLIPNTLRLPNGTEDPGILRRMCKED